MYGSMKVAVVKYNAGNIFSVIHALQRMGVEPLLTDSPEELRSADRASSLDRERPAMLCAICGSEVSTKSSFP